MKNIIIFGATGSIGKELVPLAINTGYSVTAFVRNRSKITVSNNNLNVIEGDVLDAMTVERAMKGQDVVLVTLGAGRKGQVREQGTANIIRAMEKEGIRRLICQSTLGTGDSNSKLNFFWKKIMFGWFLKEAFLDHERQENLVRKSDLDWTIVRPGAFSDGPRTESYIHGKVPESVSLKLKISRADVASFLLKQINEDQYIHQSPILSY